MSRTIELQQGILYGPVRSRRLGLSLGVNLLPDEIKVCSLNCRYCQYSWTGIHATEPSLYAAYLPARDQVRAALGEKLEEMARAGMPPDTLTFSGNGEATLHPEFPGIAADAAALRDEIAPRCRTAILSNGTTAHRPEIRDALTALDDPIMKLDAGREETFLKLNGPVRGLSYERLLGGLRALGRRIVLQALFVTGAADNSTDEEVAAWIEAAASIGPRGAQLYTLDRGPADRGLLPVPERRLTEIAERLRLATGVEAEVF